MMEGVSLLKSDIIGDSYGGMRAVAASKIHPSAMTGHLSSILKTGTAWLLFV
jgi:hypothetical protein